MKRKCVVFKTNGDPRKVLELVENEVSTSLSSGQVLIEWICSPVNPLDINIIQGVYAIQRALPAIGGSEGAGTVVKSASSLFEVGDLVAPMSIISPDCWAEYGILNEEDLVKMDSRIRPIDAATFMVNPCTAWIMLKDFVELSSGDYVIQNSANSGVGRNTIQLAKALGIKTINIVRDRPDIAKLKKDLCAIGADHVFTEEEFAKDGRKFVHNLNGDVKLALNGVGGRSCLSIAAVLCRGGTLITYGGMSRKPHEISTSSLVFNDIRVRGVAAGQWIHMEENREKRERMFKELQPLFVSRQMSCPPMDVHSIDNFHTAIDRSMSGKHGKQLLIIKKEERGKL